MNNIIRKYIQFIPEINNSQENNYNEDFNDDNMTDNNTKIQKINDNYNNKTSYEVLRKDIYPYDINEKKNQSKYIENLIEEKREDCNSNYNFNDAHEKTEDFSEIFSQSNNLIPYNKDSILKAFKKFIINGSIDFLKKFYGEAIHLNENNNIFLPVELYNQFIQNTYDTSILSKFNFFSIDSKSLVVPIRQNYDNTCFWHNYGEEMNQSGEDKFLTRVLNLKNLYTCPSVTYDFLNKINNVETMILEMISYDIRNQVIKTIFTKKNNDHLDSLLNNNNIITVEGGVFPVLRHGINSISGFYRQNGILLMSRGFFNCLIQEITENYHAQSEFIFKVNNTIMGYTYYIVDQMEDGYCVFGDVKSAYMLVTSKDLHMERITTAKRGFVEFFFSTAFAGALINPEAIVVLYKKIEKDKDQ